MFVDIQETRRHNPSAQDDNSWQESFFLGWSDSDSMSGGSHHISLHPHLGLAHVWSWLIVAGKVVGRSQLNKLTLPSDDFRDMTLGTLRFVAGEAIRILDMTAQFDQARLELNYSGYHDPIEINVLRPQGRHYESIGAVRGQVTLPDRAVKIQGSGWQDHSWGPRNYSHTLSERWLFSIFGDDLGFSVYSLNTSQGAKEFGFVLDAGRIHIINKANVRAAVADDGLSPAGCDTIVRTENGRGYRFTGSVFASALTGGPGWSGTGGYFGMNGLTKFEHGDRIGEGILEIAELKALSASERAELDMD
jgi:hypothetical protein